MNRRDFLRKGLGLVAASTALPAVAQAETQPMFPIIPNQNTTWRKPDPHYRGDQRYRIKIEGSSPLLMHSTRGIDEFSPEKQEIAELTKKRGTNKTVIDAKRIAELETSLSLWLDAQGAVTIPPEAIRACIETSARKLKEGPLVREGMLVEGTTFHYDQERYGETLEELSKRHSSARWW